jgi:DNA mismatch repair protein MutL
MTDIIQLLPDAIANQIAAGEVVQRPASVVKELLENAIDAGSNEIKLIVKDAGKSLIQVIDNGCGMSETDARMCFERHATSKIRLAKDLFAIRTMGFRGEAMASIAAIAHVEMKSRRHADELGTKILIEGSELKSQEACQCAAGTSISVKNLFYNVPARRNFLKSNSVEMRHILDEFQRVAIAYPEVFFSLHHNGSEVFHLQPGNLRQRIVGIFGASWNKKLVPVNEETDILKITGYIGKPEFSKKTRGEQLFFVNQRFIKSGYLNHSIMGAYEDLLAKDSYPFYVVFLEIDPSKIDINVHPTKQEIKFDDERLVYNYLKVAIRHALGQYNITPTLDFDQEVNFSQYSSRSNNPDKPAQTISKISSRLNTPDTPRKGTTLEQNNLQNWDKLYEGLDQFDTSSGSNDDNAPLTIESQWTESSDQELSVELAKKQKAPYQIHSRYIVSQIKSGFVLVDQQAAHERILYERFLLTLEQQHPLMQKELFPKTITVSPADAEVIKSIATQINALGFDLQEFGTNTFVIHGVPADLPNGIDEQQVIEMLLEQYKSNLDLKLDIHDNIARSMARSSSIKRGQKMNATEMQELIDQLFACSIPYKSPAGKNCFITFELENLAKQFEG